MMKVLLLALVAATTAPRLAHADGWVDCNGPDKGGKCNASGADSGAVGTTLLLVAGVTYGIARRKRR